MRAVTVSLALLVATGCGQTPYDDYFPDPTIAPEIAGVTPSEVAGIRGGQEVTISGSGLADTRTVVFGSRNADVLEATDTSVRVIVPANVGAGGPVEVALVTDDGIARVDGGFTYQGVDADFTSDEAISAMVAVVDCPVEAWGFAEADGEYAPLWWCGLEMGWIEGSGWEGTGLQPGFAGDSSAYGQISALPDVGDSVVYQAGDPRPNKPGQFFKYLPGGGRIAITTERDFQRDLDWIDDRFERLQRYYSYYEDVTAVYDTFAVGTIDDEAVCFADLDLLDATNNTLFVDGDPTGWSRVDLAYAIEEQDGDYYTEGYFSSASVLHAEPGRIETDDGGVVLIYDDWSGTFGPSPDAWPGGADMPFDAEYRIATRGLEPQDVFRGNVNGVEELEVLSPDLMSGAEVLDMGFALEFDWVPGTETTDPSYIVVEIKVYDSEVTDPATGWFTEIARLTARGDDAAGTLRIPIPDTADMPTAEITLDENYDFVGRYAEVTIARHQLRKVPVADGESLVIDFIHAVQAPVDLVR